MSAKTARRAAKQLRGRDLHVYLCPTGDGWHLGHLPDAVVHGEITRDRYRRSIETREHNR